MNSPNIGMVYVACHSFHMGGNMAEIMAAAGDKLRLVHVADTMDHHRSHGLRYITNRRAIRCGCTSTSRSGTAT